MVPGGLALYVLYYLGAIPAQTHQTINLDEVILGTLIGTVLGTIHYSMTCRVG